MPSARVSPSTVVFRQQSMDSSHNERPLQSQSANESNDSTDNYTSDITGIIIS